MVYIKMKTVKGSCKCGASFEYTVPANVPSPTMCDPCAYRWQEEREKERQKHNLKDFADACGIPEKYRHWDPSIAAETGSDMLLEWLRNLGKGSAWIAGKNGVGKTHAVHYHSYELIVRYSLMPLAVRASSWLREVASMRASDGKRDEGERRYKRSIIAPLLVLDDFGKENLTQVRAELLYDIIDERDRANLPIWITTNFEADELHERINKAADAEYGHAVMKRLARMIPKENSWPQKQSRL